MAFSSIERPTISWGERRGRCQPPSPGQLRAQRVQEPLQEWHTLAPRNPERALPLQDGRQEARISTRIPALLSDDRHPRAVTLQLVSLTAHSETGEHPFARVLISEEGSEIRAEARGGGIVDATFKL